MHRLEYVIGLHRIAHHSASNDLAVARIDFNQIRIFQFEARRIRDSNLNIGFGAVGEEFRHQACARHGVPLIADAARVECELSLWEICRCKFGGHEMGSTIRSLKLAIGKRLCPAPLPVSYTHLTLPT